ncbi:MAG: thioredoxin family protein [Fusobacteriaceae bacterium]|nr:thioredoxin family protein [Fusobacteriaceae bacterium]
MFNEEIKNQLKDILKNINKKVIILYFSEGNEEIINVTKGMLQDIENINDFIVTEYYDLKSPEAKKYEIIENGTMLIVGEDRINTGIYYYGAPAGYEINSFVHTLLDMGGAGESLPKELIERIQKIDKNIDIKVFVGLGCPHCPGAVISAHTLAKYNPRIKGIMVEASGYAQLSEKFKISSVPRIIINDGKADILGNQPLEIILNSIEDL